MPSSAVNFMKMTISGISLQQIVFLALVGMLLNLPGTACSQVEPGDRREDVLRVLGYPDSGGRMGDTETLNYKNGTKIILKNGLVHEVSVPGQIRIGNTVKVIEVAKPQPPPPPVQTAKPVAEVNTTVAKAVATNPAPSAVVASAKEASTPKPQPITASKSASSSAAKSQPATSVAADASGITAHIKKIVGGLFAVFVVVSLVMYGFTCFCFKLICDKVGKPAGALVWIPIAQFIPLLRIAGMREWMLALLLVPIVNIGFMFVLWSKICVARGKSPWLAAALIIPLGGLFMIAYLAFTAANERPEKISLVTGGPIDTAQVTDTTEPISSEPTAQESGDDMPFSEMPDPSASGPALEEPSPAT
jgi:hypothetical protein